MRTPLTLISKSPKQYPEKYFPCGKNSCETCNQIISDQSFKSNLTGKKYKTTTYDDLSCCSSNIIYEIHCLHCGLVYVGETGRSLNQE